MGLEAATIGYIVAGISATTAAATAIDARNTAKDQEKAAKEQAELEQAIEGESSARARRAAASEAQVARAQIANQAGTTGFAGTAVSAAQGGVTNQFNKTSQDLAFSSESNAMINSARLKTQQAGQKSDFGVALGVANTIAAPIAGKAIGNMMAPEA